jgi:beta-galactosidase
MGNSPGDFQEYRDLTEKYPRLCGGFVWEFCDHAVLKGYTEDGSPMYLYGGDHGELQHDGNFCLDGLVYPDRRPHTGLYEYKNVHRPLRAAYDLEEGLLTIGNYWDFTDPSTCVQAHYTLTQDGAEIESGVIEIPHIAPHDKAQVPLELDIPDKGRCFLRITYFMEKSSGGLSKGHILGFDEIRIRNADSRFWRAAELSAGEGGNRAYVSETPVVRESDNQITVSGRNFTYTMDTLSGLFTSFAVSGREFLKAPIDFNLWRAPTDNDSAPAELWRWERLDHTVTRAYEVRAGAEKDTVVIRVRQSVAAMSVKPFLRINAGYTIYPDGRIRADIEADKDPEVLTLPRLGLRMFLSPELANTEYYGIGPKESYIDKCRSGSHGLFTSKVADLHEDYIRPQENGSHCDCDYVRLDGEDIEFTVVSADEETFSFNASLYTQEELESKRHNYELEKCGDTVLCIDHRMAGIGSKSCGPDLSKEYRVDADHYEFAFIMKPDRTLFKN